MSWSKNNSREDCSEIPVYISVFGAMTKIAKQLIRSLILADCIFSIREYKLQPIAPSTEQIITLSLCTVLFVCILLDYAMSLFFSEAQGTHKLGYIWCHVQLCSKFWSEFNECITWWIYDLVVLGTCKKFVSKCSPWDCVK